MAGHEARKAEACLQEVQLLDMLRRHRKTASLALMRSGGWTWEIQRHIQSFRERGESPQPVIPFFLPAVFVELGLLPGAKISVLKPQRWQGLLLQ